MFLFSYDYKISEVMPRKFVCPKCCRKLSPLSRLGLKDFEKLRDAFLRLAVERDDVFLSTTPEELKRFITFMNEKGRYDMVVDGLNVSYAAPKHISLRQRAELVTIIINNLGIKIPIS